MAQQSLDDLVRLAMDRMRPAEERVRAIAALQELESPEVPELMRQIMARLEAEGKALTTSLDDRPDYLHGWFDCSPASWSLEFMVLLLDLSAEVPSGLLLAPQVKGSELKKLQLRFVLSSEMRKTLCERMGRPSQSFPALALQPSELPVLYNRAAKPIVDQGGALDLAFHWY
jgi:hypothetical protein